MKLKSLITEIITGENCVAENKSKLAGIRRAYIVTGKNGAKASGALSDILCALDDAEYKIFDEIPENPPLEICFRAGREAADFGADYVIAIGGGSAIDGAKAIAAFAKNPLTDPRDIFNPEKLTSPGLPVVAVPTTAGTGSEVNSFSIITVDGGRKKQTFKSPSSTPVLAFVDHKYTYSLSREYSVSCALDALAHSFESYLSPKATDETRTLAERAAKDIWSVLFRPSDDQSPQDAGGFTQNQRKLLANASNLAGQIIGVTGTGFPHPMGYNLTMSENIPHGRACAAFYGEYLKLNRTTAEGERLLGRLYSVIGTNADEAEEKIPALAPVKLSLSEEKISDFVSRVRTAANYSNSPYVISEAEMAQIYRKLFP